MYLYTAVTTLHLISTWCHPPCVYIPNQLVTWMGRVWGYNKLFFFLICFKRTIKGGCWVVLNSPHPKCHQLLLWIIWLLCVTLSMDAHWAYTGVCPAYAHIQYVYTGVHNAAVCVCFGSRSLTQGEVQAAHCQRHQEARNGEEESWQDQGAPLMTNTEWRSHRLVSKSWGGW